MCRVGVEVAGGGEGGKHQPQEPGIAPSVGSGLALPGTRPLSSPRTLLRQPGLKQPRWAHRPLSAGPGGQARRSPSGPALLEELNIEQGDTVARQKQEVL